MPTLSLPYQPSYIITGQQLQNVIVDYSSNRTRYGRKRGGSYFQYDLIFRNRQLPEFQAFQAFWQQHYPATLFTWTEPYQGIVHACYFISEVSYEIQFAGSIDYKVKIETTPVQSRLSTFTGRIQSNGTLTVVKS